MTICQPIAFVRCAADPAFIWSGRASLCGSYEKNPRLTPSRRDGGGTIYGGKCRHLRIDHKVEFCWSHLRNQNDNSGQNLSDGSQFTPIATAGGEKESRVRSIWITRNHSRVQPEGFIRDFTEFWTVNYRGPRCLQDHGFEKENQAAFGSNPGEPES